MEKLLAVIMWSIILFVDNVNSSQCFCEEKKCACLLCSCFLLFFIHLDNEDIENSVKSLHPLQDGVCCYVKLWRNIHVNYRREQLIQETATPAAAHISQHGWELRASDISSYGLYQIPCFLFLSNNSIINNKQRHINSNVGIFTA